MTAIAKVRAYDSQSVAYHQAFQVFLDHTDQKVNARRWLDVLVESLPQRRVFVDAGAGNGQVTTWFLDSFERTIAIEPNPSLRAQLTQTCPSADVRAVNVLDAQLTVAADLILCSHVFYYLERSAWKANLSRMASWLAPEGVLVLVLQNPGSDCMRMLQAFLGRSFSLAALAQEFVDEYGSQYQVEQHLVSAHVSASDLATAYVIAEFMLNLLPLDNPPERGAVEEYLAKHFAVPSGGFRFSCDQDFLMIRRTPTILSSKPQVPTDCQ